MGSLASLPYGLAECEQNFLIPSREQALIWGDLVPQMILSAVIPRWWNVTPVQLHWVGIHMAYAETLLAESVLDPNRRAEVMTVARSLCAPGPAEEVEQALLAAGDLRSALENVMPSEMYLLAIDMSAKRSQFAARRLTSAASWLKKIRRNSAVRPFHTPLGRPSRRWRTLFSRNF